MFLTETQRLLWLRLARTESIGPRSFATLIELLGSIEEAIKAAPELARRNTRRAPLKLASEAEVAQEYETLLKKGGTWIASCEPNYPPLLRQIYDAPPILSVLGRAELLTQDALAVVGSRNASANGQKMTERLVRDLGSTGLVIISGLARGIDTVVHQHSLDTGTIAVLGGGIDRIYPPENATLYHQIRERGALVSEQPFGMVPRAQHFPRRNRIISGISQGTVVIEAHRRSGSLITAKCALEQSRDVYAVPGSPLDPRAEGGNYLIKEGAFLVETAKDILQHVRRGEVYQTLFPVISDRPQASFDWKSSPPPTASNDSDVNAARNVILQALSATPLELDELVTRTGLSVALTTTVLLELELSKQIERLPGDTIVLRYA